MLAVLVEVAVLGVGIVLTWAYYAFGTSENNLPEKEKTDMSRYLMTD